MRAKAIFVAILISMSTVAASQAQAKSPCNSSEPGIECYLSNFKKLYSTDYDKFWDIYYYFANKAKKCQSPSITAEFLRIASVIAGNAEVGEAFAEDTELLLFSKPECYFDGALLLDAYSLSLLKNNWHSSFTGQQKKLVTIFRKYSKVTKYEKLLMGYSD